MGSAQSGRTLKISPEPLKSSIFQATGKQQLSSNWKYHIPDLKVGTLDQLVGLSDDLGKVDSYVEQVTRKLANYLGDVLEDQRERLVENLVANGMDLATYLTRFQWDMAKYPIRQSLKNLSDIIGEISVIPSPSCVCKCQNH